MEPRHTASGDNRRAHADRVLNGARRIRGTRRLSGPHGAPRRGERGSAAGRARLRPLRKVPGAATRARVPVRHAAGTARPRQPGRREHRARRPAHPRERSPRRRDRAARRRPRPGRDTAVGGTDRAALAPAGAARLRTRHLRPARDRPVGRTALQHLLSAGRARQLRRRVRPGARRRPRGLHEPGLRRRPRRVAPGARRRSAVAAGGLLRRDASPGCTRTSIPKTWPAWCSTPPRRSAAATRSRRSGCGRSRACSTNPSAPPARAARSRATRTRTSRGWRLKLRQRPMQATVVDPDGAPEHGRAQRTGAPAPGRAARSSRRAETALPGRGRSRRPRSPGTPGEAHGRAAPGHGRRGLRSAVPGHLLRREPDAVVAPLADGGPARDR